MKKKVVAVLVTVLLLLTGCGSSVSSEEAIAKYGSDTLKVYNVGEYIDTMIISDFEREFGVKVIYEVYDSNEMMYTKVQAGDVYDILVPSDYMIQRLVAEDALMELDLSKIPNIEYLTDEVKNLPFDPENKYSVPYFWGSVGIVYNTTVVDEEDLKREGWDILKDPKYAGRIYMYDSERDAFMIAFKALGYSMNTQNMDEIEAAYQWLMEQRNTMNPVYVGDEVIDGMINGNKDMAIVYSGDATNILLENEEMSFYMPDQGTNLWVDCMVIPKNAENPLLAHEFINYMLEYDIAYTNSEWVCYTSPHKDVLADLSSMGGYFEGNVAYLPRQGYEKDEVFEDNRVLKEKLTELWIKVKAGE
ncbi:MAG: ABC transporter substrate-binding protein [Peptococcaceae bacterium]|nr:ABC transporter substrate-binding protein [Peptococcaceae bacterium]MBQ3205376.1 ABC transporter substrate-binding protein [Peptococcaceae bacterium]